MKHLPLIILLLSILLIYPSISSAEPQPINMDAIYEFEPNFGDWNDDVLWRGRLKDGFVYVTDNGLHFHLFHFRDSSGVRIKEGARFKMTFDGKGKKLKSRLRQKKSRRMHKKYQNNPKFAKKEMEKKLRVEGVYDDIDLDLYTENGRFRFDLVAYPGATINDIEIGFEGPNGTEVSDSAVALLFDGLDIRMEGLKTYRNKKEKKNKISSKFKKNKNKIKFEANGYSSNDTVIIDPVIFYNNSPDFNPNSIFWENILIEKVLDDTFLMAYRTELDTLSFTSGITQELYYDTVLYHGSSELLIKYNLDSIINYTIAPRDINILDIDYVQSRNSFFICGSAYPDSIYTFQNNSEYYYNSFPLHERYDTITKHNINISAFIIEMNISDLSLTDDFGAILFPGTTIQLDSIIDTLPDNQRFITIHEIIYQKDSLYFIGSSYSDFKPLKFGKEYLGLKYFIGSMSLVTHNWSPLSTMQMDLQPTSNRVGLYQVEDDLDFIDNRLSFSTYLRHFAPENPSTIFGSSFLNNMSHMWIHLQFNPTNGKVSNIFTIKDSIADNESYGRTNLFKANDRYLKFDAIISDSFEEDTLALAYQYLPTTLKNKFQYWHENDSVFGLPILTLFNSDSIVTNIFPLPIDTTYNIPAPGVQNGSVPTYFKLFDNTLFLSAIGMNNNELHPTAIDDNNLDTTIVWNHHLVALNFNLKIQRLYSLSHLYDIAEVVKLDSKLNSYLLFAFDQNYNFLYEEFYVNEAPKQNRIH